MSEVRWRASAWRATGETEAAREDSSRAAGQTLDTCISRTAVELESVRMAAHCKAGPIAGQFVVRFIRHRMARHDQISRRAAHAAGLGIGALMKYRMTIPRAQRRRSHRGCARHGQLGCENWIRFDEVTTATKTLDNFRTEFTAMRSGIHHN